MKFRTYAENLRHAMNTAENKHGRPFGIRELATLTDFSFEHIRKAYKGEETPGRDCNDVLCDFLGLDAKAMWGLAEREKIAKRIGYRPVQLPDPKGQQWAEIWRDLSDPDRDTLLRLAQALVGVVKAA